MLLLSCFFWYASHDLTSAVKTSLARANSDNSDNDVSAGMITNTSNDDEMSTHPPPNQQASKSLIKLKLEAHEHILEREVLWGMYTLALLGVAIYWAISEVLSFDAVPRSCC